MSDINELDRYSKEVWVLNLKPLKHSVKIKPLIIGVDYEVGFENPFLKRNQKHIKDEG